jgi:hypothetical protein
VGLSVEGPLGSRPFAGAMRTGPRRE